jgi:hypothetical protein
MTSTQAGGYERQTRVLVNINYIISGQYGHLYKSYQIVIVCNVRFILVCHKTSECRMVYT